MSGRKRRQDLGQLLVHLLVPCRELRREGVAPWATRPGVVAVRRVVVPNHHHVRAHEVVGGPGDAVADGDAH
eukprot:2858556-Heterocapsa_arctica.AAC.1